MNTKYRMISQIEGTISGKLLYLLLLDTVDAQNKIQLSQRRISEALGISKGTVSRNFHRLKRSGYINIVPMYHCDGGRAANQFVVLD